MKLSKGTIGIIGREAFYNTIQQEVGNNPRYQSFEVLYFQNLFDDAYKQINQVVDEIDVLIAGPRHYQLLQGWFPEKPVIKIKPLSFDILDAIKEAFKIDKRIFLISPYMFSCDMTNLKDIFRNDINIYQYEFADIKDLKRIFALIIQKDAKTVIGGSLVCNLAKEYGLKAFHYYSKEAIIQTIDDAINLMLIKLDQKADHEKLKRVIDFSNVGLMVVDSKGKIQFINSIAINMLGRNYANTLGVNIDKVLSNNVLNFNNKENKVMIINGVELLCDKVLSNDGSIVYRFQEAIRVEKAGQEIRKQVLSKQKIAKYHFDEIIGSGLHSTIDIAKSYATSSEANIIIIGPTGTGKELFASSIHNSGPRAQKPFVPVNCAALPENLLESELFGYEAGAFTGANKQGKRGLIELAHQGTLFLDEIGEMPRTLQAKLLRVLQEKEVLHIGGEELIPIDIRVIAATNRSLEECISQGEFRADLYYRLASLVLEIPPLAFRRDDVLELIDYFLKFKDIPSITAEIIKNVISTFYKDYDWTGNVREIQNIIERIVTYIKYTHKQQLSAKELSKDLFNLLDVSGRKTEVLSKGPFFDGKNRLVKKEDFKIRGYIDINKSTFEAALDAAGGNKSKAARLLGVSRSTLWRWSKLNG